MTRRSSVLLALACTFLLVISLGAVIALIKRLKSTTLTPQQRQTLPPICITLTSLPERFNSPFFERVIESLCNNSVKPHQIILNIPLIYLSPKHNHSPDHIPRLAELKQKYPLLRINRDCVDHGPATKILGGMHLVPPNALMMIVDDDIVYKSNVIERLATKWISNTDSVVAMWVDSDICRYDSSKGCGEPCGFAGWLVRRRLLQGIGAHLAELKECRRVDDTWIGAACLKLKVPIRLVGDHYLESLDDSTGLHPAWEELGSNAANRAKDKARCLASFGLSEQRQSPSFRIWWHWIQFRNVIGCIGAHVGRLVHF